MLRAILQEAQDPLPDDIIVNESGIPCDDKNSKSDDDAEELGETTEEGITINHREGESDKDRRSKEERSIVSRDKRLFLSVSHLSG